ncbi:AraC family transcriptional regulator [Pseudonocardia sp. GCM10023141]|uniref:AraC family transcriptional regulator n=1 Tax=Pseudonocardia sp. GCM10023141 TaxID=3252653 RepID=UPI00360FF351
MSRLKKLGFIDVHRTTLPVRRRVRSRGIPPALADNEIFYAESVREAARLLGKALSPATLALCDDDAHMFAASLHGMRLRDVSMLHIDLGIAATLDVPAMGPYFAVHMPTNGHAMCTHNGREFEANPIRAVVTSPGMALTMQFAHDSPQLIIRIEQEALARHLTRLMGGSLSRPIVFEPEMDLTTDAAMRWNGAIQLLHAEAFYPDSLVQHGQGIGPLEELLMSTLLLLQPSNYQTQLLLPAEQAGRRVVREALDYIEAHLSQRITMNDIAKSVHMSVRAVQQGFRDELGTSPMLYLRDRRLERAREDLTDAVPSDGVTVTSVAERWGFTHLSSFSVLYRKRWDESPSETLRR